MEANTVSPDDDRDVRSVIIDNGSGTIKAGFSGDDAPRSIFPTVFGRPKYWSISHWSIDYPDFYIGEDAQNKREVLTLRYPIEHGVIIHWDAMEKIWLHTYNELGVDPKAQPVLHTEPPLDSKANREKKTEIMFETFEVPAFYVSVQGTLALYASGRTTGVAVGSGEGNTHVVPIFEGYSLPHAIKLLDYGGRDLTHYLSKLLSDRHYNFTTNAEMEIVKGIKEKSCFVTQDIRHNISQDKGANSPGSEQESSASYEFPGGEQIIIDNERFLCPEALFKPSLLGRDSSGIHETIYESILAVDCDIRHDLFENIVLYGGNTMFPGIEGRMKSEMERLTGNDHTIKIIAPPERIFLPWIGGSILSSVPTFQDMWIQKDEYDEHGPSIVHKKCC